MSYKSRDRDEFDVLLWVLVAAVVIGVIAGLIEFNARRNAAAMTRELLRPATPQEQARIQADIAAMDAEAKRELRAVMQTRPVPQQRFDPRPLEGNERCLSHQRFRRVPNGWIQNGTC